VTKEYKFKNYYESEPQVDKILYDESKEKVLKAFANISQTYARKHVRPGIDYEDLYNEAQLGVLEAIEYFSDPSKVEKKYPFKQYVLYKIRERTYQYCLRNAIKIKTPYYIQRGSKHVAQITTLLKNAPVAFQILGKEDVSDSDIREFLYNENERLPLKSDEFIRAQINKNLTTDQFNQVYDNVVNHKRGSAHSFVKKNLTDVGKILHIKEKIWYNATSNNMPFSRVISLILEARSARSSHDSVFCGTINGLSEKNIIFAEMVKRGREVCGTKNFDIFLSNKYLNKTYKEISVLYNVPKNDITEIIKRCIKSLKEDDIINEFND
jgi:RNA polymerase sigma factor (sigma-70 family)